MPNSPSWAWRVALGAAVLGLMAIAAMAEPASNDLKAALNICQRYRVLKPSVGAPDVHFFHSFEGWQQCELVLTAWYATDEGKRELSGEQQKDDDRDALAALVNKIQETK